MKFSKTIVKPRIVNIGISKIQLLNVKKKRDKQVEPYFVFIAKTYSLESHGILRRVMESHGNLITFKKNMSQSLLRIMLDKNFTECILLNYE